VSTWVFVDVLCAADVGDARRVAVGVYEVLCAAVGDARRVAVGVYEV